MKLFWAEGYDGASVARLSQAMGVPKASLYRDHGDKRGLFMAAIDRYAQLRVPAVLRVLERPGPPAKVLEGFLLAVIDLGTADPRTPGCLVACVLAEAAGTDLGLRQEFRRRLHQMDDAILTCLRRFPPGTLATAPEALAPVVAATARGLMTQARAGEKPIALQSVARTAAMLWCNDPSPSRE